jgi:hypothetical protein
VTGLRVENKAVALSSRKHVHSEPFSIGTSETIVEGERETGANFFYS